jgi:hypothetical protein
MRLVGLFEEKSEQPTGVFPAGLMESDRLSRRRSAQEPLALYQWWGRFDV